MAMRDLVTGGAACAVPGSSSSSNPVGALANVILGSVSKSQEVKELPGTIAVPNASPDFRPKDPLSVIPGSEYDNQMYQQPDYQSSDFLPGFRSAVHGGFEDAWNELHQPSMFPHAHRNESEASFAEFEHIYGGGASSRLQPTFEVIRAVLDICLRHCPHILM